MKPTRTAPDPTRVAINALPTLYAQLADRVTDKLEAKVENKRHSKIDHAPSPIDDMILDFLYYPDHDGHLGLVPTVLTLEVVVRAARGLVGTPLSLRGASRTAAGLWFLSQHLTSVEDGDRWNDAAARFVRDVGDGAQDRLPVDRLRLMWEATRRHAEGRLRTETGMDQATWTRLVGDALTDYIDFEGGVRDAVQARFDDAAGSALGFAAWMSAELRHLHRRAEVILGLTVQKARPLSDCPWCGAFALGLSPWDEDVCLCGRCGRVLGHLSDGTAGMVLRAFREAGWVPRDVAAASVEGEAA